MNIRLFASLVVAGCSLWLTGCLPESKNPLSTPATSVTDSRLEGVYAQRGDDGEESPGYWHFHYRQGKPESGKATTSSRWLEVMTVEHPRTGKLHLNRYEALASQLGGRDYLTFKVVSDKAGQQSDYPYSFARYEVNWRGELSVWLASEKVFAAAVAAGKLQGKVKHHRFGDSVVLTDSTANLAAFVAQSDPKTLFDGKPLILRRIAP